MPLVRRQYLSSAVTGLKNSPKISHTNEGDFFNPNCLHRDQQISSRCCRSNFNSVSARLQCYLSNGPLKRDFLDTYLTMDFGVRNFRNTSAMRVIFFPKMFKIESKSRKCKKKIQNILFISEIKASQNVAINCLFQEENTYNRQ